jgi:hypothetical protein
MMITVASIARAGHTTDALEPETTESKRHQVRVIVVELALKDRSCPRARRRAESSCQVRVLS